jgi:hypothetical protein
MLQTPANLLGIGEGLVLLGQNERGRDHGCVQFLEQGQGYPVIGNPHPERPAPGIHQSPGNLPAGSEDEGIGSGGVGLEQPVDRRVEHGVEGGFREVSAEQREGVVWVQVPDAADPLQPHLVPRCRTQGVARIRGVGDHAAVLDDPRRLADETRLWVLGVYREELAHGELIYITKQHGHAARSRLLSNMGSCRVGPSSPGFFL